MYNSVFFIDKQINVYIIVLIYVGLVNKESTLI
jgi:hypothetical protein